MGSGDLLRGNYSGCGDCIKVLDLDGRLQFMSDGGKRVMEVDNFDALKGCPWPDFWSGEGNAQAHAAVAAAKEGRMARFQNAANTARGNPRHWDVQVSPIFGHDGKPAHLSPSPATSPPSGRPYRSRSRPPNGTNSSLRNSPTGSRTPLPPCWPLLARAFRGEAYKSARDIFNARIRTLGRSLQDPDGSELVVRFHGHRSGRTGALAPLSHGYSF